MSERYLILACGSRNYTDAKRISRVLSEYNDLMPVMVLHGDNGRRNPHTGAIVGADKLAGKEALLLGFSVKAIPAEWDKYTPEPGHKNPAGAIRNRQMLDMQPNLVIAFGNGAGTTDTVTEAHKRGITVRREK